MRRKPHEFPQTGCPLRIAYYGAKSGIHGRRNADSRHRNRREHAIFTVINALLLRPLAFAEPHRLALISSERAGSASRTGPLSWLRFEQIRDHARSFSSMAAYWDEVFSLTGRGGDPEEIKAARVSWNFFNVLGVAPSSGRTFLPEEDKPGGDNVVMISHNLAARLPGAATLTLDGITYTVIGVLPAGFQFGLLGPNIDIYAPRIFELNVVSPRQVQGGAMFLNAVARLRPGVTFRQAQEEMAILAGEYRESHPGFPDADPLMTISARNLRDDMVGSVRTSLLVFGGAVGAGPSDRLCQCRRACCFRAPWAGSARSRSGPQSEPRAAASSANC